MPNSDHKPTGRTEETSSIQCGRCGSTDVRPSFSNGFLDRLLKAFQVFPYRCRSCQDRFYRRTRGDGTSLIPQA